MQLNYILVILLSNLKHLLMSLIASFLQKIPAKLLLGMVQISMLVACLSGSYLDAAIRAEANFSPAQIAVGDQSRYFINIIETSSSAVPQAASVIQLSQLQMPDGLKLVNVRRDNRQVTQIINGQVSHTTTVKIILDALANVTGEFSVASFEMTYKGQKVQVPSASLLVVERPKDAAPVKSKLIQFKAKLPDQIYLGQRQIAYLQLYIHESVELLEYPTIQKDADAFTIPEIQDPEVRVSMLEGHRYKLVEWPVLITPIQSGEQSLQFYTVLQLVFPSPQTIDLQIHFRALHLQAVYLIASSKNPRQLN